MGHEADAVQSLVDEVNVARLPDAEETMRVQLVGQAKQLSERGLLQREEEALWVAFPAPLENRLCAEYSLP